MVRVKICGITNEADAHDAVSLGAHALGFIFAPSPRQITPEGAKVIIKTLPPFVATVGVYVNEKRGVVQEIQAYCGLHLAQLHGDESPTMCASFMPNVIKAFQLRDASSLSVLETYKGKAKAFLFDTYSKDERGGTGRTFDWNLAVAGKRYGVPVILSGGLNPDNVREAIKATDPFAVDVGTGVEKWPGKKDAEQMRRFMERLSFSRKRRALP